MWLKELDIPTDEGLIQTADTDDPRLFRQIAEEQEEVMRSEYNRISWMFLQITD